MGWLGRCAQCQGSQSGFSVCEGEEAVESVGTRMVFEM